MKYLLQTGLAKRLLSSIVLLVLLLSSTVSKLQAQANTENPPYPVVEQPRIVTANVVRLMPIAALDIGFGVGASYERYFGTNKKFGLVLPFYLVLESTNDGSALTTNATKAYNTYFYFMPGMKFYPTGHSKLTYAFGPSLLFGFGNNKQGEWTNDNYGHPVLASVKYARKRFGVLMNNYVTFNIGKSFDLGLEGGLGFCYFDKETYDGNEFYANSAERKGFDLAGQFSLSIGYKF